MDNTQINNNLLNLPLYYPTPNTQGNLPIPPVFYNNLLNIPPLQQQQLTPDNNNDNDDTNIKFVENSNDKKKSKGFVKCLKKDQNNPQKLQISETVTQGFSPQSSIDITSNKSEEDTTQISQKNLQDLSDQLIKNQSETQQNIQVPLVQQPLLNESMGVNQNSAFQFQNIGNNNNNGLDLMGQYAPDMNLIPFYNNNFQDQTNINDIKSNMEQMQQQIQNLQNMLFQQQNMDHQSKLNKFLIPQFQHIDNNVNQEQQQQLITQQQAQQQIQQQQQQKIQQDQLQNIKSEADIIKIEQEIQSIQQQQLPKQLKENLNNNAKNQVIIKKKQKSDKQPLNTSHVPINMMNNLVTYLLKIYDKKIQCNCPSNIPKTTVKKQKNIVQQQLQLVKQEDNEENNNSTQKILSQEEIEQQKCQRCKELEKIIFMKKSKIKNIRSFQKLWENKRLRALSENYFLFSGSQQILQKNYRSSNNRQALFECLPSFLDGVRNYQKFWKLI